MNPYKLIVAYTYKELETQVSGHMLDGWEPLGPPVVDETNEVMIQAITFEKEEN